MQRLRLAPIVLPAALVAASATAVAAPEPLRVIELFTSHGCSSCPPADALLGRLIDARADLIALEYHVDYWDALVHGADGNWVDPFGDAEWTQRQRGYDQVELDGRRGVYTPQAIVNGRYAAVGSDAERIDLALDVGTAPKIVVAIEPGDGGYLVTVDAEPEPAHAAGTEGITGADIVLVRYRNRASTDVTAGENRRRTLVNHHIVLSERTLGRIDTDVPGRFRIDVPEEGQGCAVVVRDPGLAPILGAAACPRLR